MCLIYGGQSIQPQIKKLEDNPVIVIGTPGRIIDHIHRGHLNLSQIQYMVLNEADEMLKMGFLQNVQLILDQTSYDKQNALFSATPMINLMILRQGNAVLLNKKIDLKSQKHI
jgi:ATP-dependent RNA helicase DeaD